MVLLSPRGPIKPRWNEARELQSSNTRPQISSSAPYLGDPWVEGFDLKHPIRTQLPLSPQPGERLPACSQPSLRRAASTSRQLNGPLSPQAPPSTQELRQPAYSPALPAGATPSLALFSPQILPSWLGAWKTHSMCLPGIWRTLSTGAGWRYASDHLWSVCGW